MTKKDYIVFAEMFNDLKYGGEKLTNGQNVLFDVIVEKIGDIFYADNERFNFDKFKETINKKV